VRVLPGPVLACLIDADNHFHEVEFDELPVLLAFHETERSSGRTRKSNYPYPALLGRDFSPDWIVCCILISRNGICALSFDSSA